ncbi:hypothetical protein ANN_17744 [Periplaneta americana]|uniref:Reverse transcriptase domain-containing protein n=1 Tax=Periplaneta americana TaxID=6978 RepID=A0ABQ8SUT6_PERAM|nr:hypothetical protein ANN_17744 [Periplaneta americana]
MVEIMNALMTSPVIPSDICLGIMVLIPKIACPKTALDYRSITLLNSDYKIFMRCMKTRLSTIFPHVIGPHQQCLVAGRNILNATCAIRDSISVAKQNKQNHMLISLDFDHAFDRVRHNYLLQRMMELNIDPAFIACLRNIMAVSNSKLLVNGHLTQAFPVERSVRQGCPLSMHLFALTLDPLLQNISCIYPMNTDTIIRAYADDVTIVAVDATILPRMYQCIQQYSRETGAQLNEKKTKAMYIGKEDKIPLPSWLSIHSSIKILGVTFFNDLSQTIRYNWNSVTNAVRHVLSAQKFRFADLVKRAQYINTYALSKAWYMAQILPIPSLIGKKLRSATGWFLWNRHILRVPRDQLTLAKSQGGLGVFDPYTKALSLFVYRNLLHVQGQGDDFSFTFFSKWVSITKLENPPDLRGLPSHAPQIRTFKQEISYIPQNILNSVTAKHIYKYMNRSLPAPKIVCRFPVYNWKRIWKNIRNSVLTFKQQDLWFRVVNDIFPTNSKLYHIKLARTSLCPYCQEEDNLQHRFLECLRTKQYWETTIQDISDIAHIPVTYIDLNFILKPSFYYKPKTTQAAIVKRLALCMETILD